MENASSVSDGSSRSPSPGRSSDGGAGAGTPPKRRAGRTKFRETRHPVYHGVRRRGSDRWVCEVREPNTTSRLWLGTFATAEMAARAHDVAVLAMRGPDARLNFADSPWRVCVPDRTASRDEIRRAAAEAAEQCNGSPNVQWKAGQSSTAIAAESSFCQLYVEEEYWNSEPQVYAEMAQGMLIDPPPSGEVEEDVEWEVRLWSF